MEANSPDFESIKQTSPYDAEYWSARDLAPLLGYSNWQNFEVAIKRGKTACEQVGQVVADHFTDASKMVVVGSGARRNVKDYYLSRFACYLIAQNGDPRKPEIAAAQAYFAVSTRRHEIHQLYEEQQKRLQLRERVSEGWPPTRGPPAGRARTSWRSRAARIRSGRSPRTARARPG